MAAIKDDLIKAVQSKLNESENQLYTKVVCDRIIEAVVSSILEVAQENETIRTSIGTFRWTKNEACTRRNPRTGEPVEVPAFSILKFSASKSIRTTESDEETTSPEVVEKVAPAAAKPAVKPRVKQFNKQPEIKATVGKRK